MAGLYNTNLGILGFQEYEGSMREENLNGEPRFFRRFIGPASARHYFLATVFGLQIGTKELVEDDPVGADCVLQCPQGGNSDAYWIPYPSPIPPCAPEAGPAGLSVHYAMVPVSYRVEPHDDGYANNSTTTLAHLKDFVPEHSCLVLVEVEYQAAIVQWPRNLTDSLDNDKDGLPPIIPGTAFRYESEKKLELRTAKVNSFGVASATSASLPSIAAGADINTPTVDEIGVITPIGIDEFTVTWLNVPYISEAALRSYTGTVNAGRWFGYPSAGVCLIGATPRPRVTMFGTTMYDIEFRFVARTVPANGETRENSPLGVSGAVHAVIDDRVGIFNRVYWDKSIPNTSQRWWPVVLIEHAKSNAVISASTMQNKAPFASSNFASIFTLPPACETYTP